MQKAIQNWKEKKEKQETSKDEINEIVEEEDIYAIDEEVTFIYYLHYFKNSNKEYISSTFLL